MTEPANEGPVLSRGSSCAIFEREKAVRVAGGFRANFPTPEDEERDAL